MKRCVACGGPIGKGTNRVDLSGRCFACVVTGAPVPVSPTKNGSSL